MPIRAATAATCRVWLDWTPPIETSVSQPCASASATRYSSFLVLLPPKARPLLQSSRLAHTSAPPSDSVSRSSLCTGDGPKSSGWRANAASFMSLLESRSAASLSLGRQIQRRALAAVFCCHDSPGEFAIRRRRPRPRAGRSSVATQAALRGRGRVSRGGRGKPFAAGPLDEPAWRRRRVSCPGETRRRRRLCLTRRLAGRRQHAGRGGQPQPDRSWALPELLLRL